MGRGTSENFLKARKQERGNSIGGTEACTRVAFRTTSLTELEHTPGTTGEFLKANGNRTKCMEKAFLPGKTVDRIKASTPSIKSTGLGPLFGPTVRFMRASGSMGSKMASGFLRRRRVSLGRRKGSGLMVDESDGFRIKICIIANYNINGNILRGIPY
jgi:hypothetical protein